MTSDEARKLLSIYEQVPVRSTTNYHPCMMVGMFSEREAWIRPFHHKVDVRAPLTKLKYWKSGRATLRQTQSVATTAEGDLESARKAVRFGSVVNQPGHSTLNQQQVYIERSLRKAMEVARATG